MSGTTGIIDSIPPHQSSSYTQSTNCSANQVQVATQTQAPATTTSSNIGTTVDKKQVYTAPITGKSKKTRYPLLSQQQSCQQQQSTASAQQTSTFPAQNYQLDPVTGEKIYDILTGCLRSGKLFFNLKKSDNSHRILSRLGEFFQKLSDNFTLI